MIYNFCSYGGAQAAIITLLDEVASLRNSLDATSEERDKLRVDCQVPQTSKLLDI